jgi:glycosyltransferase involved in cell wall biosynthesis
MAWPVAEVVDGTDVSSVAGTEVRRKLLFIVNVDWAFVLFRLPIALAALRAGYEVHLGAALTGKEHELRQAGIIVHALPISRGGTNPFAELLTLSAIFSLVRELHPDIVHLVSMKPVLYGGLAARIRKVPAVVASVTGLGFVFIASGLKARMIRSAVSLAYRVALGTSNLRVIFQNPDDRDTLLRLGRVAPEKAVMIRGSGVDLAEYPALPEPDGVPVVAMAARLLWDKGVGEFVAAARLLRENGVKCRFQLIGEPDAHNPVSISAEILATWRSDRMVELLGFRSDIAQLFSRSHLVVLPSYREGLPKVLIEAAACGRAVVTTDVPGCREAIIPGETGLLVPVKDPQALAGAIQRLLEDPPSRKSMGQAGRRLAEEAFDIRRVVDTHLAIYEDLMRRAKAQHARIEL